MTQFVPDAQLPCGWAVYKAPELVPEKYFARLGADKGACLRARRRPAAQSG